MANVLLQCAGGGFYLLNKVLFSRAERAGAVGEVALQRRLRIAAWLAYLVGLPPWIVIFVRENNWIAAVLENNGIPAMLLGLVVATRRLDEDPPRWLNVLRAMLTDCLLRAFLWASQSACGASAPSGYSPSGWKLARLLVT